MAFGKHVAPRAIEAIAKEQLLDVGNDEYTATVGAHPDLRRQDGSAAQPGDVLSLQEDGSEQTRPLGTAGNFEKCKIQGAFLVYRPIGTRTFFVPLANVWPNG